MANKYSGQRVSDKSLDELILAKANDKYRNRKRIDDAMNFMLSSFIRFLPLLVLFCLGYIAWYYIVSTKSNLDTLLGLTTNVVIYFAGIVTPTINQKLKDNVESEYFDE